ncbi:MAG: hypothetical protein AB8H80_09870 [Planctomycetota bacterium]
MLSQGFVLVPTLDVSRVQSVLNIAIPALVRPITFYAQAFSVGNTPVDPILMAHSAYQITAL